MSNIFETRLKIYPNGTSEYVEFKQGLTYANSAKSVHRSDSGRSKNDIQQFIAGKLGTPPDSGHSFSQYSLDASLHNDRSIDLSRLQVLSRRKSRVRDYVLSGNFRWFGTLTFRHETAHRELDDEFRHKMVLFTRMLRRRGVDYYIVAELHSGGGLNDGYIHLHGLFGEGLPVDYSPASKKYLHIPIWHHGFSNVSIIRDQTGTANYVTKYVTKEALKGRSVWVSQGLKRPRVLYNSPDLLSPIISEWYSPNVNITLRGN